MTDLLDGWGFYTDWLTACWWCVLLVMPSNVVVHCYISVIWSCILRVLMLHEWPHVLFMYQLDDDNKGQEPHESYSYPGPDDYLMYSWWKSVGLVLCLSLLSWCYCCVLQIFFNVPCSARHTVTCSYMFIKHVHNQKWQPDFMPTKNL